MDRAIVIYSLLLVALTWLLYKLAVLLEPRGDEPRFTSNKPTSGGSSSSTLGSAPSSQMPIHQRLRQRRS